MMPVTLRVKAMDESERIGIAEFGGAEKHDLRLIDGYSIDAIRKSRVLSGEDRRDSCHIETLRVLLFIREARIIAERVAVIIQRPPHLNGLFMRRRIGGSRFGTSAEPCAGEADQNAKKTRVNFTPPFASCW